MSLSKKKQFFITLAAFLVLGISFKVMVLIEGLTEVRPVNAIPPAAGLLFGPVGAFACGIGNFFADMAGTLSIGSVLGIIGNFMAAYLPYRLWYLFSEEKPSLHSGRNILKYICISAVGAMTVAWILSFGLYALQGVWVEQIYVFVFFNNLGFSVGLGMPIIIILTSDGINLNCCPPPGKNRILRTLSAKKTVLVFYTVIMLVLFVQVVILHGSPAKWSWLSAPSLAALTGLILLLI